MQQLKTLPTKSTQSQTAEFQLTDLVLSDLPPNEPFRTLAIRFVGRLDDRLNEFSTAIQACDFGLTAELAHWVKGTSGSVGLRHLSTLAAQLEQASKNSDVEEVTMQYTSMCQMIGRSHEC